ncbi:spore germination protein [Oceanobacillus sp. AG]|uniref:spore germination protein n=1 Tax=Oceanobacillus sp. AG TaxID=2681969 RepID=UPI0012ECB54E|nr:spore germination protein [Oceanobacillus sp. AG]
MRPVKKQANQADFPLSMDEFEDKLKTEVLNSQDLSFTVYKQENKQVAVFYIPYLIDLTKIEQQVLNNLLDMQTECTADSILSEIPLSSGEQVSSIRTIRNKLTEGYVGLYVEQENRVIMYELGKTEKRALEKAETESVVVGPLIAFTESLESNLNIINWRMNTPDLAMEKVEVGKRNPKETRIIYLKSVANETDVNTMRQRLTDLEIDMVEDIHMLKQYILDSSTSIFAQFVSSELVDRSMYAIKSGKIIVMVEDSPFALIAPSTLFSFFESTEDRYFHWTLSMFVRFLRFLAAFVTLLLTPMYVVATTYHYELVPSQLLVSLGESRAVVPFPPLIEVFLIELVIELLREAGARLPTKVGQTIGIVGGVVVGTAAVQAGISSNILIILVTMSALASYATPSYIMGNTIRFVRFPLFFLAGFYGIIGLMFGICLLVIHLVRLESLGRPYLAPLYPLRLADFNKSFYRLPEQTKYKRFLSYRPKDKQLFNKERAAERRDVDE